MIIEDILQKRHLLWEGVYELCHFIYRWGFFTLRWEHSAVTLWLQIINVDISCHIPACFVSPLINGSGWFSLFGEAPDKAKPSHNVRSIKPQSIQIKKKDLLHFNVNMYIVLCFDIYIFYRKLSSNVIEMVRRVD